MNVKLSADEIRRYWTEQAVEHKTSPAASWSDVMVIEKEIEAIGSRLTDGDRVLDVGCANGYSTITFARTKKLHIRGVDYIPEMVAQARQRLASTPIGASRVEFELGDILSLNEPVDHYDKVISTRVVINLPSRELQRTGLRELARVLRPGGTLLLSEATVQGWERLNRLRAEWDLPAIPMPGFNLYLDEAFVVDELSAALDLVEIVNFASSYYVGTRVIKPLLAKASGASLDVANPLAEWNRWCSALPTAGDYGTQKLFVFRKR